MDRNEVKQYIGSVIEEVQAKQMELIMLKGDADGPRTSHSSTIHLDIEMEQDHIRDYIGRCKSILTCLEEYRPTKVVSGGSIVTLSVDGEDEVYIVVEVGGGTIGTYQVVSLKSPVGKAIAGRLCGETITTKTPSGSLTVKILDIA